MKYKSGRAKPRGKPFTKNDPRIGKTSRLSTAAAVYAMRYKNRVADRIAPEKLGDIVADAASRGRVWAIQMLHDDMVGKATQPIGGDVNLSVTVKKIISDERSEE